MNVSFPFSTFWVGFSPDTTGAAEPSSKEKYAMRIRNDNTFFRGIRTTHRPRIIAHRGASGDAPENTVVAFRKAVTDGADILELDVRPSADRHIIVCHDRQVKRTTNGTGFVDCMTLNQLRGLDAGYRFTTDHGETFPFRNQGVQIPTLEEILSHFPNTPLNIELKVSDPHFASTVLELLKRHDRLADVMFLPGGNPHRLVKSIRTAGNAKTVGHSRLEIIKFLIASQLHCPVLFKPRSRVIQIPARYRRWKVTSTRLVRHAHRLGMEVHVWTINDNTEMLECISYGVDGIFTDFPGRMKKLVNSL
jgi:glycerophosphoryl diester phosphodiesterase